MSDTKIITVTLTPSLDRTLILRYLAEGYQNRTEEETRMDPAGEGLNFARALHRLGMPVHAVVLLGKDATGRAFRALLDQEELDTSIIMAEGRTRSNTIILDIGNNTETQVIEENADITIDDVAEVVKVLKEIIEPGDIVLFSGYLPNGIALESYAWLTDAAQEAGARVNISSIGAALKTTLGAEPELLALRRLEAESYFNYPVRDMADVYNCARKLQAEGAKSILMEIHKIGHAMLVTPEGSWIVVVPNFDESLSIGLWEAFMAAYLAGRLKQKSYPEALALGAAAATYTGAKWGAEFGRLRDFEEHAKAIEVVTVEESLNFGDLLHISNGE
jgi:1-phosphofructokinase family hexose kinase